MQIFIPWSDELAEEYPDLVSRLVPYQPGMHCAHLAGIDEAKNVQARKPEPGSEHGSEEDLSCKDAVWAS